MIANVQLEAKPMMPTGARGGGASAAAQRIARRGDQFGLSSGDAEDYYDVVMTSEDEDDASDMDAETERNTQHNAAPPPPRDEAEQLAALSLSDTAATPSTVMRHIGSISYNVEREKAVRAARTTNVQTSDDEFVLTEDELRSHTQRRSVLETALDSATRSLPISAGMGEAPFRFGSARGKPVTSPAPTFSDTPSPGNAPQQSESAKRKPARPLAGVNEFDSDDDQDFTTEPDQLYDDAMDDADEKWVQSNLRGDAGAHGKTDASLCCPCCFVTVCMDCQRHVKYHNQYRARAAMNCRVKKDEILTYATTSSQSTEARQHLSSMTSRHASGGAAAAMLGRDEYFGVVCSDCGTTVGVYDAQQTYHFFNILPSNC